MDAIKYLTTDDIEEINIELVKKYDGKCSEYYIRKFCDYIKISLDEYWKVVNKFRGNMWKKDSNENWYNTVWDLF